jgi:diaminohydroxyphosphoribosylaminopyrimidine deaminase/5-amino-6-(5-phosphoribosylamino)uracil reductase
MKKTHTKFIDEEYMRQALQLSMQGYGYVNPNPMVGAVIVKNQVVIGQGYHEFFGGPHAEINALSSCLLSPEDATMYVTLEPCSHYGKTPPCVDAIIEAKIKKVVCAMIDPNPLVAGRGLQKLHAAGISVVNGVLEREARQVNAMFLIALEHQRDKAKQS